MIQSINRFWAHLKQTLHYPNLSQVSLFVNNPGLYPGYTPRFQLNRDPEHHFRFSLIATCLNEEKNISNWMKLILHQTRLPDELILVDGGSTDRTPELIQKFIQTSPFPIHFSVASGANISKGRNLAIQEATHEHILVTDLGCEPDSRWIETICKPFELMPEISVSFGYSDIKTHTNYLKLVKELFLTNQDKVDPEIYLPSSRNIAFTRSIWAQAKRYPEWLTNIGEDTVFDLSVRAIPTQWAYVPEAVVYWHPPATYAKLFKMAQRYAFGDGEAMLFPDLYFDDLKTLIKMAAGTGGIIFLLLLTLLKPNGFLLLIAGGMVFCVYLFRKYSLIKNIFSAGNQNLLFFLKFYLVLSFVKIFKTIGYFKGFKRHKRALFS